MNLFSLFVLFVLMPGLSKAIDMDIYQGKYQSANTSCRLEILPENGNLFISYTITGGGCWHKNMAGNTYFYECHGEICRSYSVGGLWNDELRLLSDGSIFVTYRAMYPEVQSGTDVYKPVAVTGDDSSVWNLEIPADNQEPLYIASVASKGNTGSLQLQCYAPTTELSMVVGVDETFWKAAAYSVKVENKRLQIKMGIGEAQYQFESWALGEGHVFVRLNPVATDEIQKLKAGQFAKMTIETVDANGAVEELKGFTFTLKGSSKTITQLQEFCSAPNAILEKASQRTNIIQ